MSYDFQCRYAWFNEQVTYKRALSDDVPYDFSHGLRIHRYQRSANMTTEQWGNVGTKESPLTFIVDPNNIGYTRGDGVRDNSASDSPESADSQANFYLKPGSAFKSDASLCSLEVEGL